MLQNTQIYLTISSPNMYQWMTAQKLVLAIWLQKSLGLIVGVDSTINEDALREREVDCFKEFWLQH
jgi:hypothetical protein